MAKISENTVTKLLLIKRCFLMSWGFSDLYGVLARDIVSCSWARHLTLTVPLFAQVYKWVPADLILGVNLRLSAIPSRGGVFLVTTCHRNRS